MRTQKESVRIIHHFLKERGWTISTAESCTAGMLAGALSSITGASAILKGGVVAYTLDSKVSILGVNRELAAETDCIDSQVAVQMARGAERLFGSNISVAVTGYAERSGELIGLNPYAHCAVIWDGEMINGPFVEGPGLDRVAMQELIVSRILEHLATLLYDNKYENKHVI